MINFEAVEQKVKEGGRPKTNKTTSGFEGVDGPEQFKSLMRWSPPVHHSFGPVIKLGDLPPKDERKKGVMPFAPAESQKYPYSSQYMFPRQFGGTDMDLEIGECVSVNGPLNASYH